MTQCTCLKDKKVTCIVHPTTRSLKEYIEELHHDLQLSHNAIKFYRRWLKDIGEIVDETHQSKNTTGTTTP